MIGRYIEADPIGLAGGVNLYRYLNNNPPNLVDNFGLDPTLNPDDPNYPLDPDTWKKPNPATRCHVETHNDPIGNLVGGSMLVGSFITWGVVEGALVLESSYGIWGNVMKPFIYQYSPKLAPATDFILKSNTKTPGAGRQIKRYYIESIIDYYSRPLESIDYDIHTTIKP